MPKTGFLMTLLLMLFLICSFVQCFPIGGSVPEYELYEPQQAIAFTDLPGVKRQLKGDSRLLQALTKVGIELLEPYTNSNFQKMNARDMFRALINFRRYK
ncbi:hypothetical protein QR680_001039 [Steinernema hermaphroditum]|uniref:Uncharacterized protein n=1 Tax=Steinernema hermaphroditum TaxID=289476 RepID=A0AA39GYR7_9BILA|nr:hypothetical protein QR680_001039 [Steinernema hermaphroditum]